jgi:hypothetical protein
MSSPTQRTLAELRKRGYPLVQVVEKWVPRAMKRQDLFGVIDVLAVSVTGEVVGVQATSGSNVSARVAKIAASDKVPVLRLAGWRLLVHGWRKNSKGRYVLREVDVT